MYVSKGLRCFPRSGLWRAQKRCASRALHILSKYLLPVPYKWSLSKSGDSVVNKTPILLSWWSLLWWIFSWGFANPGQPSSGKDGSPAKADTHGHRNLTFTHWLHEVIRPPDLTSALNLQPSLCYLPPMGMGLRDLQPLIFLLWSFESFWTS